jgi:hypothetical protein
VPVDLAACCRRESVKGGGRDALNGYGNDAENCVKVAAHILASFSELLKTQSRSCCSVLIYSIGGG